MHLSISLYTLRHLGSLIFLSRHVLGSKHLKHEDPDFSGTFKAVVDAMASYFDVEVYATRLNFYRSSTLPSIGCKVILNTYYDRPFLERGKRSFLNSILFV